MGKGRGGSPGEQEKLFANKPYLCVRFHSKDPESNEFSDLNREIHNYPRVQALGIMLVETAIGFPLLVLGRARTRTRATYI